MKLKTNLLSAMLLTAFFITGGCTTKDAMLDLSETKRDKRVFCYSGKIELKGGTPDGGRYSGKGVYDNKFYPQEAGNGKHKITYSAGWFSSASDYLTVWGGGDCPKCDDTYEITCTECNGKDLPGKNCPKCNSTGKVKCIKCNGTGRVENKWWGGKTTCEKCNSGKGYVDCTTCDKNTHKVPGCDTCKGAKKIPCPLHTRDGK